MRVADLMQTNLKSIDLDETVAGAVVALAEQHVSGLPVVDHRGRLVGVISTTDILGERSMRVAAGRGLKRGELTVADVMTPAERVEVIALADVEGARVGHVVATLAHAGRQHALVVDNEAATGRVMVRGILSLSQVARQLGKPLQLSEVARTFAEIEAVLSH